MERKRVKTDEDQEEQVDHKQILSVKQRAKIYRERKKVKTKSKMLN